MKIRKFAIVAAPLLALGLIGPAAGQTFEKELTHSIKPCQGAGPALWIQVWGIKNDVGTVRVVLYRAKQEDWLKKGRWMQRVEIPAKKGSMQVCMPVPEAGSYAVAMRHDANGNDNDDIFADGGGMSNDPSINLFNLGKPHVSKATFSVGKEVKSMRIKMRYL